MIIVIFLIIFIFHANANEIQDYLHISNTYIINRLEFNNQKNKSNCSTILTFKYDFSNKLSQITYNDEENNNEYAKFKELVAVKNNHELVLLMFDDLAENGKDSFFKEYLIMVNFLTYMVLNTQKSNI